MRYKASPRVVSAIALLLGVCSAATARLLDVTLSELAAQSDVIVYGVVVSGNEANKGTVVVTPRAVLKGPKRENEKGLIICNVIGNTESLDLRSVHRPLVIFARNNQDCLMPVHGISSTIVVNKGLAATASIVDQPNQQPISEFLKRIRHIVSPDGSS
jgi:hypothetical protein